MGGIDEKSDYGDQYHGYDFQPFRLRRYKDGRRFFSKG